MSGAGNPDRGGEARGRVLVAKLGLDGHDVGAKVVSRVLRDAGFEVVYTGIRQTPESVAAVARDEDVDVIGVSMLSGAHVPLVSRLLSLLDALPDKPAVVVGGAIPDPDHAVLTKLGVGAVVGPHATSSDIVEIVDRLARTRHAEQEAPHGS